MTARIEGSSLRLVGDEVDRVVAREAMTFAPAGDSGPSRIAFADGGLCEFDESRGAGALFAALGHRRAVADRMVSRTWQVVAITAAFVAGMAMLYRWGVPWIADEIIDHAPRSWEASLGGKVLASLDRRGFFRTTRLPLETRDRITARFATLRLPPEPLQLRIVFRRLGAPNALALPGGTIVLGDEIVDLAAGDDDAIVTVLAHEVGHVAHRDVLRQTARSAITSAIAAWYFGDVSNVVAVMAGGLGSLSYSREAEHEADLYAVRVMRASGISTHGAAQLFRKLDAWTPPSAKPAQASKPADGSAPEAHEEKEPPFHLPEYLSTHPDTAGRIELFESNGASDDPR